MAKLQAIRGMNDILPDQTPNWQYVEKCFQAVVHRYGYREIRFPILEQTQLFKRSIGEVTDIVEKEMYSFYDRNGDNLSLRPEGTAGCVRAADQHGLLFNQQQRLWYQGPMFRHERPQKGRYKQFGVEAFGMAGPDIDAEVIQLSASLWQDLGLEEYLTLEINNIGTAEDRKRYAAALEAFLSFHAQELDDDARNRTHSNPMRVLDSKNPAVQEILKGAPALVDYVSDESIAHYSELKSLLSQVGIEFIESPRLVRGLDYYNNCVFEWTTDSLGAQGTVCGGGRYDGLVEQLGGKATVAAGFAMGVERLVLMLDSLGKVPEANAKVIDVYMVVVGGHLAGPAALLAKQLRQRFPEIGLISHCGGGKYSNQMKRAFNSGARLAIVLDTESEQPLETVKIRQLNDSGDSVSVEIANCSDKLAEFLSISE